MSFCTTSSSNLRPIRRLTANRVFCGLVTAWRLADWPSSTSSSLAKATIDGVVRSPSLFSITRGLPPSMIATHDFGVPRSMALTLLMGRTPAVLFHDGLAWDQSPGFQLSAALAAPRPHLNQAAHEPSAALATMT